MMGDNKAQQEVPRAAAAEVAPGAAATPAASTEGSNIKAGTENAILAQMNSLFATLNGNQNITNNKIGELSASVAVMNTQIGQNTAQINTMQQEIKDLQARLRKDLSSQVERTVERRMAAAEAVFDDKLQLIVNKKMDLMTKELDKVRAVQAVQAQTNAQLCHTRPRAGSAPTISGPSRTREDFEARYLECRRSIRV